MERQLKAVKRGKYIFAETKVKNEFILFREDNKLLGEINNLPVEMCQDYMYLYTKEENTKYNAYYMLSSDCKCMKVIAEKIVNIKSYRSRYH